MLFLTSFSLKNINISLLLHVSAWNWSATYVRRHRCFNVCTINSCGLIKIFPNVLHKTNSSFWTSRSVYLCLCRIQTTASHNNPSSVCTSFRQNSLLIRSTCIEWKDSRLKVFMFRNVILHPFEISLFY